MAMLPHGRPLTRISSCCPMTGIGLVADRV
jgi:hypothetical protein